MVRIGMRPPAWAGPCLLLLCAAEARSQLVINEFMADPDGSDGGREFVELLNTGVSALDLGGWQLQFANGADGPVWQARWTGVSGSRLEPGARFLIVDRNWTGVVAGDAEVALALQNGPDAIRLVRDGKAMDTVGYGPLTDAAMMETAPAPVVAGRATARRPDGIDSGDNSADFMTALATPGGVNFERFRLTSVACLVEPPSLDQGGVIAVDMLLRNDGLEPLPLMRVCLARAGDSVFATLDGMTTGEERRLVMNLHTVAAGPAPLELAWLPPGATDSLRVRLAGYQVGPAALYLSEVLGAPRDGQGEWIELGCGAAAGVDMGRYRLADAEGSWQRLPAVGVGPGGLAVVAQDSLALGGWLAANETGPATSRGCGVVPVKVAGWPSLNNTAPEGRTYADRVLLADSTGVIIDHVTLPEAAGEQAGRSLERAWFSGGRSGWAWSLAAAGSTPGCANSVSPPSGVPGPGATMVAVPAEADRYRGDVAVHFQFTAPEGGGGWDLIVFDLDGRPVRDLGGEHGGPGSRSVMWDLRDDRGRAVPSGGYVAALRLRDGTGAGWTPLRAFVAVR